MVSLLRGLPAIIAEIEQRVLACVPTAFATDTWIKADRKQSAAQNDILIDYWRHFDLEITDSDPSAFQGNYAYQNREIQLDIYTWYSRAGANRVAGNPDVDWQALMLQDAHDLQRALQGPIVTADGSTGRLLYDNANRSEDDEEATLIVSFRLPVFLRGTAQVPALYLGPNQAYTLNAGSKFYLVAQSDLACSASLSSSPAGCAHATAIELGSGTPQVLEVTAGPAGTYTFTLASSSGAATCTVVVYPASDFVLVGPDHSVPNDIWSVNLAVASANDGIFPVTGSANLTLPENVTVVNNKGVIPVTITSRGSHSVTVGNDTCSFTSATPSAKIPYYKGNLSIDWNNSGKQIAFVAPHNLNLYAGLTTPDDNIKKFTLAFRFYIYTTVATSSYFFLGTPYYFNTNYPNWIFMPMSASLRRFNFKFRNAQNTALKDIAVFSETYLAANTWANLVVTYQYDVIARSGSLKSYNNGVQKVNVALGDDGEIGFYHTDVENKMFQANGSVAFSNMMYDLYICNNSCWDETDIANFGAKTTIDPAKYSIYWPMTKNTDLPYLVDYDRKNNVPMYIPGPHPNLEWVPKP